MKDDGYTNREIDMHHTVINEKLDKILEQTIKTNGRTTKNEIDIANQKTSTQIANWAFGITVPIIMTMVVWIFFNEIGHITNQLHTLTK